jgi:hypothetical protein
MIDPGFPKDDVRALRRTYSAIWPLSSGCAGAEPAAPLDVTEALAIAADTPSR